MKTTILKHRFLYLFILLGLTLSFNGCSSDDDDETETQTFLEKYDGTKWVTNTDEGEFIIKFYDDTNNPYDNWFQEEVGSYCHIYHNTKESWGVEFEIKKNLNNEFTIESTSGNYIDTLIFKVQGDNINMTYRLLDNGEEKTIYNLNLNKTSINLNDIVVCD